MPFIFLLLDLIGIRKIKPGKRASLFCFIAYLRFVVECQWRLAFYFKSVVTARLLFVGRPGRDKMKDLKNIN